MRRRALVIVAASLVALIIACVFDEAFGVANFAASTARSALAVVACASLSAVFAAVASEASTRARGAAAAAILAGSTAFVLLRGPSPWTDLGPFGAGPLTALAVIHLPVVVALAIACALALGRFDRIR